MFTTGSNGATLCAVLLAASAHCLGESRSNSYALVGGAGDVDFRRTELVDAKGKPTAADLVFETAQKRMLVEVAGRSLLDIPYASVEKLTYDYSKQHRIKEGAIVMVASLGAGAVVMMTSSKSHWLTIEYHDGGAVKSVVLKLSKKEYKDVLRTARAQTGKDIEFLKDAKL